MFPKDFKYPNSNSCVNENTEGEKEQMKIGMKKICQQKQREKNLYQKSMSRFEKFKIRHFRLGFKHHLKG